MRTIFITNDIAAGFTNNADLRMNQAGFVRLFVATMKRDFVTGLSITVLYRDMRVHDW